MSWKNQNGQLILETLKSIAEPATITTIISHVANTAKVHPDIVKYSVQETLNGGLRYGYIQCNNRRYFAESINLEELARNVASVQSVESSEEPETVIIEHAAVAHAPRRKSHRQRHGRKRGRKVRARRRR